MTDDAITVDIRPEQDNEPLSDEEIEAVKEGMESQREEINEYLEEEGVDTDAEDDEDGPDITRVADHRERLIQNAEGDTRAEKLQNALMEAQQTLQQHSQQYQQFEEQREDAEVRATRYEKTIERVKELPEGAVCLQQLEGGVIVEVPPEGRDTLCDDLADATEEIEQAGNRLEERTETMEEDFEVVKQAALDIREELTELTE